MGRGEGNRLGKNPEGTGGESEKGSLENREAKEGDCGKGEAKERMKKKISRRNLLEIEEPGELKPRVHSKKGKGHWYGFYNRPGIL